LKTVVDICFVLASYRRLKKIADEFTGQGEGHFSEGSRSLDKVMSYSDASSDILYLMAYTVCPQLLFSIASRNRSKTLYFLRHNLRENCEAGYSYVFHVICVMPMSDKTF